MYSQCEFASYEPSGHYMYQQFNMQQFYVLSTQFMCFVWIWEQTAIISLYSIDWLVFVSETQCVYCAVRTGSLYVIQKYFRLPNCWTNICTLKQRRCLQFKFSEDERSKNRNYKVFWHEKEKWGVYASLRNVWKNSDIRTCWWFLVQRNRC